MENKTETANPSKDFENMVAAYLASNPMVSQNRKTSELEIRFGTNPKLSKPISKIDYENVVKQLYAAGFTTTDANGLHILRINNEYYDTRAEKSKLSNIRAEIVGVDLIQEYCKTNSIQKLIDMPSTATASGNKIKFTQKSPPPTKEGGMMRPVDFADYNFRSSYQLEQDFTVESNIAKNIIAKWTDSRKLFRHLNRVRFAHPVYPIFADVTIVKGSKKTGKIPMPQYTVQDAEVFKNPESYEIELEVDNRRVGVGSGFDTLPKLMDGLRKCIRIVLGGLQGTNYPIAYSEKEQALQSYMQLVYPQEVDEKSGKNATDEDKSNKPANPNDKSSDKSMRVTSKHFTGPSSVTLQMKHLLASDQNNILTDYTVTDKADGERRLLFIHENGRIYMIDMNMNVIFTGAITTEKTLHNSLIDGELIKYDKNHKYINLYAAFDIYYVHGQSVRDYPFARVGNTGGRDGKNTDEKTGDKGKDGPDKVPKYRLDLLQTAMTVMNPKSIVGSAANTSGPCDFHIRCKNFQIATPDISIFDACAVILSDINQNLYEYNTDGLIFTPANLGVGSSTTTSKGPLTKATWQKSFKWKPPQFNTIDFLVSFKKDEKTGRDEVHTMFQDGKALERNQTILQYKTLILHCGFDKENHRFINPFEDVINDNVPKSNYDNEDRYTAAPFRPTNPYDPDACFCNVYMENGQLRTEEHEIFEENMIVEFRYDTTLQGPWRWVPLRVRYDKTAELRATGKNFGNAYNVANDNWQSIHNPVSESIMMTGQGIPDVMEDADVYYNRTGNENNTKALRDFHNLFVKKRLILGVSQGRGTLIDFAVGKAGDLPKWIQAKLAFVFGIDVSRDNIMNAMDGACSRYLRSIKDRQHDTKAIFLQGNSGVNIRSGRAFMTDKDKMIARALFGTGPKERATLKEGVYKQYGVGQDGFSVASCQFALHYFFENNVVFHEFLRNVSECTATGGYFVGTCYDGKTVFQRLRNKRKEEGIALMRDDTKIYEITKMYDQTGFPDDELSLGYMIHVYQDSINKVFPEYLVNFDYFVRMMENYGFVLATQQESKKMGLPSMGSGLPSMGSGLPNGSGLFSELFSELEAETERNPRARSDYGKALSMTSDEKWVSFMNRYFVFRKTHSVDAEKIYKQFVSKQMIEDVEKEVVKEVEKEVERPVVKKLGKKIVLDKYEPVEQESGVTKEPMVTTETTGPTVTTAPKIVFGEKVTIKRVIKK
jgi:hypothetical protein